MRKIALAAAGIALASSAAYAQQADDPLALPGDAAVGSLPAPPLPTEPALPSDIPADSALPPADTVLPEPPVTTRDAAPETAPETADAATVVTDAEVESFAEATVKVQAISTDATIADDQKQTQMAAAVQASGIAPERYNEIGEALNTDTELRARVQTAMARHAGHNANDG